MANDPKKNPTPPSQALPEGFTEIKLETFRFKLNDSRCRETPLRGYLIDYVKMPAAKRDENPDWWCFVFHLTAPCNALDREGEVKKCMPGDIVLLSVPAKLRNQFGRLAINPTHVEEVFLGDWKQVDIGGGKKMWSPGAHGSNGKSRRLRDGFCQPPIGPNADPARLLAEKNGSPTDVDEVPFN